MGLAAHLLLLLLGKYDKENTRKYNTNYNHSTHQSISLIDTLVANEAERNHHIAQPHIAQLTVALQSSLSLYRAHCRFTELIVALQSLLSLYRAHWRFTELIVALQSLLSLYTARVDSSRASTSAER